MRDHSAPVIEEDEDAVYTVSFLILLGGSVDILIR